MGGDVWYFLYVLSGHVLAVECGAEALAHAGEALGHVLDGGEVAHPALKLGEGGAAGDRRVEPGGAVAELGTGGGQELEVEIAEGETLNE